MKKTLRLIRLASILANKYASIDAESIRPEVESTIRTAVLNASAQSSSNIMPFVQMATQDQVSVTFYIMRDGKTTKAYDLKLEPANDELLPKYQPLLNQVQDYLNKNWELYPSKKDGEDISYKAFVMRLTYSGADADGNIA